MPGRRSTAYATDAGTRRQHTRPTFHTQQDHPGTQHPARETLATGKLSASDGCVSQRAEHHTVAAVNTKRVGMNIPSSGPAVTELDPEGVDG